jgi:hypothetical protein
LAQNGAPCLWMVDLSFMNSDTGSGNVAKCSNILQDIGEKNNSFETDFLGGGGLGRKFTLKFCPCSNRSFDPRQLFILQHDLLKRIC